MGREWYVTVSTHRHEEELKGAMGKDMEGRFLCLVSTQAKKAGGAEQQSKMKRFKTIVLPSLHIFASTEHSFTCKPTHHSSLHI